jgi:hypothetical protein
LDRDVTWPVLRNSPLEPVKPRSQVSTSPSLALLRPAQPAPSLPPAPTRAHLVNPNLPCPSLPTPPLANADPSARPRSPRRSSMAILGPGIQATAPVIPSPITTEATVGVSKLSVRVGVCLHGSSRSSGLVHRLMGTGTGTAKRTGRMKGGGMARQRGN